MASNNQPTWLTRIFSELFAIRNSVQLIQQQLTKTKRRTSSDRSASEVKKTRQSRSATPAQPSQRRQLVNRIYNAPAKPKICWYHRTYGAAANSANRDSTSCSFVAPAKIAIQPSKKKSTTMIRPATQLPAPVPVPVPIPSQEIAPWASPDSVKSDLINKIRSSRLSDSSSDDDSEREDTVSKLQGE